MTSSSGPTLISTKAIVENGHSDLGTSDMNGDIQHIIERLDIQTIANTNGEDGDSTYGTSSDSQCSDPSKYDVTKEEADDIMCEELESGVSDVSSSKDDESISVTPPPCRNGSRNSSRLSDGQEDGGSRLKKKRNSITKFFRRLSSTSSKDSGISTSRDIEADENDNDKSKEPVTKENLPKGQVVELRVDSLPQVFITKYLGSKPCTGLWGMRHTRGPVEELVTAVTEMKRGEDLPLVQLTISLAGIQVLEHKSNKGASIETDLVPIEFISYGVQDVKYTRVFSFIIVREMSWKAKKMECHAYVCDSTRTARKLSLAVALAFKEYAKSMQGKQFRFQVDLNKQEKEAEQQEEPPAESHPPPSGGKECEA